MRRNVIRLVFVLAASLATAACVRGPAIPGTTSSGSGAKPMPPLAIETPLPPPAMYKDQDMRTMPEAQLEQLTRRAVAAKDYPHAAILQYWIAERTKSGYYDLACYLAQSGTPDPAFYWLQVAALEEGVDASYADADGDLAALRADPRWPDFRTFLVACNRYFETSNTRQTPLLVPKTYSRGTPITVVVWLHGLDSAPDDFVTESRQPVADRLNVAIVGVSGTVPRGPKKFVWTLDAERDAKRVRDAVAEVSDRVTVKPGHVIALGFDQGAQVAIEIAVRNPEEFAGAIALSPGGEAHLEAIKSAPVLTRRGFVLVWGEDEESRVVQLAKYDAKWLTDAKAQVRQKEYPGIRDHTFPRDFAARFPEWAKFIDQLRGE
jgi:predicted esterase